ncbi:MAG: hypothetical protein K0Q72_4137 [Armatimonadetes bacterium]|jgi:hypothetical protein|nr:hypothetical protein [Armatimonadota bacterium]
MDHWELARKLYAAGFSHQEVRSVWAYAWNEQRLPRTGRKRTPWEAQALEEIEVRLDDIEFPPGESFSLNNYFG